MPTTTMLLVARCYHVNQSHPSSANNGTDLATPRRYYANLDLPTSKDEEKSGSQSVLVPLRDGA